MGLFNDPKVGAIAVCGTCIVGIDIQKAARNSGTPLGLPVSNWRRGRVRLLECGAKFPGKRDILLRVEGYPAFRPVERPRIRVFPLYDECMDAFGEGEESCIRLIRHIQPLFHGLDALLTDPFFGVEVLSHLPCKVRKFECFRRSYRARAWQFNFYLPDDAAWTR